jgi:hypothetical protein
MKTSFEIKHQIRKCVHRNIRIIAWLLIMLSMAILSEVKAQHLYASVYTQKTIAGLQQGTEIGVFGAKKFGVGAFFQSTEVMSLEKSINNYPFYGVTFQVPIKSSCNGVSFIAKARTGLVNHEYVVIAPELETQIDITSFIKVGFNMGLRAGHSAVGAKLMLTL